MKPGRHAPLEGRTTRRTFVRAGLGAAFGLVVARVRGREPNTALALDNCYWQTVSGPVCQLGRLKVYKCYICCQPCETVYCEWQDLGAC